MRFATLEPGNRFDYPHVQSFRLPRRTGSGHDTLHVGAQQLLAAGRDVIALLASFAAVAGVISLVRVPARRPGDAKDASA